MMPPYFYTILEVEQFFIDHFSEHLEREGTLKAYFDGATIEFLPHQMDVYHTHGGSKRNAMKMDEVRYSNIRDIEYSSGMIIVHQQVGNSIEIDLVGTPIEVSLCGNPVEIDIEEAQ